jgi:uncharacterized protein
MKKTILFITAFALLTISAFGQNNIEKSDNYLLVKGVAIIKEIPEIIVVTLNVKVESPQYKSCQEKVLKAIDKTKQIFVQSGIDKDLIKINEFKVNEQSNYKNGEVIKNGYVGAASFGIESIFSPEFTNKLLNALKNDSLSINYSIGFKLSETQKLSIRQKAIAMAITDAKEKAKIIAESSNVKLIMINSIEYKNDDYASRNTDNDIISTDNWISRDDRTGSVSSNQTIDLNPKEIGLQKSLQIKWLIRDK